MKFSVSVTDFGAIGDGRSDDTQAVQAALNSDATLVYIPKGNYQISATLRIPSRKHLLAHPFARLFLADGAGRDQSVFLIANADEESGNEEITVEGGIWDGNNTQNPRGPDEPDSYTGVLIQFNNVRNLRLKGLYLQDSESYFIRFNKVKGFTVEGIVFEVKHPRPNQDGVHLCGHCEEGVIRDLEAKGRFSTNDDLVALLADDAMHRAQNLGGDVGPIRNIRVSHLKADDCHSFVRLASVWNPISDISVYHVRGGCRGVAVNADALRYCRVPVFDAKDPQYAGGVGLLRDIRLSNFHIYRTDRAEPLLQLETRMERFVVEDFEVDRDRDAAPSAPTIRIAKVPATGVALEGIDEAAKVEIEVWTELRSVEVLPYQRGCLPLYRVEGRLRPDEALVSRASSFKSLVVAGCEGNTD